MQHFSDQIAQIFALVPIIAVMFTFSFSSAFATVTDANKIESRTEALKVITDEAQKQLDAVDAKADELIRVTSKTGLEK